VVRKAQADYVTSLRAAAKIERMDQPAATPEVAKPADAPKADAPKPTDSKMAPAKK
jgi:peptidyl-prolyl cis-trans isomerase C